MEDLLAAASVAQGRAYAPYSGFKVGAALRDEHGRVHGGANVENAAYPEGICAEAAALGALVAAGGRRVTEILVLGPTSTPISPCGGCRQKLAEFAGPETPVHLCGVGSRQTVTLGALLPFAFGPADLDEPAR